MLIYRIENASGWGPYKAPSRGGAVVEMLYEITDRGIRHPAPMDDGILPHSDTWYRNYKFGFASLRDVVKWFPYYTRPTLHRHGFKLAVYEVSEEYVTVGRRQVAYLYKHAVKQEVRDVAPKRPRPHTASGRTEREMVLDTGVRPI